MPKLSLLDTTLGKKALMAVTGVALFGFVIAHMLGHLQMFLGPERYNAYARALQGLGPVLWVARAGLLAMVLAHLWAALSLVALAAAARPRPYRMKRDVATSYAARTMKISGPLLLAFIVYHVAHFTAPGVPMGDYEHRPHDAYANFVNAFHIPWVTGLYCIAMLLLGLHLYHGAWSMLQTLGLSHPRYDERRKLYAQALAVFVTAGFICVPVAVQLGVIQ